jgi:hypothetical protein
MYYTNNQRRVYSLVYSELRISPDPWEVLIHFYPRDLKFDCQHLGYVWFAPVLACKSWQANFLVQKSTARGEQEIANRL